MLDRSVVGGRTGASDGTVGFSRAGCAGRALAARRWPVFVGVLVLCVTLALGTRANGVFAAGPGPANEGLTSGDPSTTPTVMAEQTTRGESGALEILSDGQFVYGPNVGNFDARGFLRDQNGSIGEYAELIACQADYWSINPRVLIALIETATGLVTTQALEEAQIDAAIKVRDHPDFEAAFAHVSEHLYSEFYWYLYVYQSNDPASRAPLSVTFADGTELRDVPPTNAATFAIQSVLASLMSVQQWDHAMSREYSSGFYQTYERLFPDSSPLDATNIISLSATPPSDLLKLPFASCDTWKLYQGPHDWNGNDSSAPYSSIDMGPGSSCGDPIPTDRWITAAAAGTAYVSCNGCMVKVSHGGGWETRYYHVANTAEGNDTYVSKDTHLGNPSCRPSYGPSCSPCGGYASGPHHVHFAIYQNGAYQPIDGTSLEGWTVHATGWYDGYLQKGSSYVYEGGSVTSQCGGTCPQSGGVILYWNNLYNCDNGEGDPGYRQETSPGAWNIDAAFNEKASSLKVPSGWSVVLFKDPNRGGSSECRSSDDDDFAGNTFLDGSPLNDNVSCFEVFGNSNCSPYPVTFYADHHYTGGWCGVDSEGCFYCSALGKAASSVRVWAGWSVRVYKEPSCGGTSKCFTSSDSDFANNTFEDGSQLNDQISSFRVFHNTSCATPTDAAEFVGQCQYPTVQPGQQVAIWFEVRNTGNTTWRDSDGYGLENQNGETLGASPHQPIGADVSPGGTKRWDIQMTAPTTPGTYRTARWFGYPMTTVGAARHPWRGRPFVMR